MSRKYILILILTFFCTQLFSQKLEGSSSKIDLIPYRIGYKWGFSNSKGELKIPAIYSEVKFFNDFGLAHVATGGPNRSDLSFGYIDTLGNEVIPIKKYSYLHEFVDSMAVFEMAYEFPIRKYGAFDITGSVVISETTNSLKILENGLMFIPDSGYVGLINRKGETIIPIKYLAISEFTNGIAIIKNKKEKFGLVDDQGNILTPIVYDRIYEERFDLLRQHIEKMDEEVLSNGLLPAKKQINDKSKWGVIDLNGNVIIPFLYDYMGLFTQDVALVGEYYDGNKIKWGIINKKGTLVLPVTYNGLGNFQYGASYTYINNKAGFINLKGEKISEFKYDYATDYVNGFAKVGITKEIPNTGRYWSFVDRNGVEITKRYYDKVHDFREGLARVELNSKYGFIDTLGQEIIPINHTATLEYVFDGYVIATDDGQLWEVKDKSNNILVPFKYNLIMPVSERENLFRIMIFDYKTGQTKEGFVNINGTEYFED